MEQENKSQQIKYFVFLYFCTGDGHTGALPLSYTQSPYPNLVSFTESRGHMTEWTPLSTLALHWYLAISTPVQTSSGWCTPSPDPYMCCRISSLQRQRHLSLSAPRVVPLAHLHLQTQQSPLHPKMCVKQQSQARMQTAAPPDLQLHSQGRVHQPHIGQGRRRGRGPGPVPWFQEEVADAP